MKRKIVFALAMMLLNVITIPISHAQKSGSTITEVAKFHIDQELCPDTDYCGKLWRVSSDGNSLYVFVASTLKLYVLDMNSQLSEYDLSSLPGVGLPTFDYLPYDAEHILLLDDTANKIYKYNLETRVTTEFAPGHRFASCANTLNPPQRSFTRSDTFLATCGYGSTTHQTYNLSLVNLLTEQVQEVAGLERGEGRSRSWRRILIGRDNNIYIQPYYGELLSQVIPDYQVLSETHFMLMQWNAETSQWKAVQIADVPLEAAGITNGELDLLSVDTMSNLYIVNWGISNFVQYAKISPEGQVLWMINQTQLGSTPSVIDIDENGNLLVINYETADHNSTLGIQVKVDFVSPTLVTPTPADTPTPLTPTETPFTPSNGLRGDYFNNLNFTGLALSRMALPCLTEQRYPLEI